MQQQTPKLKRKTVFIFKRNALSARVKIYETEPTTLTIATVQTHTGII